MRFIFSGALLLSSLLSANPLLAAMPASGKKNANADQAVSKLLAAADDQMSNQRWDDAIASCSEALRLKSDSFDALSKRALAWGQKGDVDKALADYEVALKIKPASPVELVLRSGLYVKKRRFDLATRDLSAAINFDPNFAMAYTMRGDLRLAMLNYPPAIADFTAAIKLDPTAAQNYVDRAKAYTKTAGTNVGPDARTAAEDYQAALADLQQAVKLDPKSVQACNELAWLQATCPEASVRDGRSAVANALQACELVAYKDAGCLDTLAAAYAEAGDFDNAVTWQFGAIELAPAPKKAAMQQKVRLYQQRQPYHEKPNPPPPEAIADGPPGGARPPVRRDGGAKTQAVSPDGNTTVVAVAGGTIEASARGANVWQRKGLGNVVAVSFAPQASDSVYLVCDDRALCLDSRTGAVKWTTNGGFSTIKDIGFTENQVMLRTAEGKLVSLDRQTGQRR